MPGLLFRLLTYRPTERRTQWENFLTEVFAGLLNADRDLLPRALWLGRERSRLAAWDAALGRDYAIETQWPIEGGQPDIAVLVEGAPHLLIESKLGAGFTYQEEREGGFQIPCYVSEVSRKGWPARVVLISLYPIEVTWPDDFTPARRDIYLGNLLWSDVYDLLTREP
jgi:hypothetical protein